MDFKMTEIQQKHFRNGRWNMFASGMNIAFAFICALFHHPYAFVCLGLAVFNWYVAQFSFDAALKKEDE